MLRLFRQGDWVQLMHGGPVMLVLGYYQDILSEDIPDGDHYAVECSWYDLDKGYIRRAFPESSLVRLFENPQENIRGFIRIRKYSPGWIRPGGKYPG